MTYQATNGVKDIQVLLKEVGVYTGVIDGVWGGGTAGGVLALFQDYHVHVNGGRTNPLPICTGADAASALQGVKDMQSNLKLFNLYAGAVDGISGGGTFGGICTVFLSYRSNNKTPVYGLGWSKRVPASFTARLQQWTTGKGYWANAGSALMGCMFFESGGTFSPTKQNNGGSNFFGEIQFGDDAAKDLGMTLADIKAMTQAEQLELVFRYFTMWESRGKVFKRLEDFYLTIFYPAAVGKGPDEVLFTRDSSDPFIAKAYIQNKGFDLDGSGSITIGEICTTLYKIYYQGMDPVNRTILGASV